VSLKKIIYYSDELNDEFANDSIQAKVIDESYAYLGGKARKIGHFIWYILLARPLAYVYMKLWYGHRIIGREKLRYKDKNINEKGIFLYGNHTNALADALIPSMISFPKDAYVVVHPNNVSMPVLGSITPSLGALPLPSNIAATKNFLAAVQYHIDYKDNVIIYPEAHIWPYYTKIRPFQDKSFRYPVQYGALVYCFTNVYRKRLFRKTPKIITYIDGPFTADKALSKAEKKKVLRDKVFRIMVQRSRQNNIEVVKYIKKEKKQ